MKRFRVELNTLVYLWVDAEDEEGVAFAIEQLNAAGEDSPHGIDLGIKPEEYFEAGAEIKGIEQLDVLYLNRGQQFEIVDEETLD